jgi:hypothetical protein
MDDLPKRMKTLPAPQPDLASYEIGYGKPPVATRLQPGKSGNPKGRPRGKKSVRPELHEERLKAIILDEAYRTIKVNDGDRQISVPMAQAIIRSMAVTAAKGNTRAQRLFAELLASTENSNRKLNDEWVETAINYKVEWEKEIERCKRLELPVPSPLPHPDDIIINYRKGGPPVDIRCPMSKEELDDLRWWLARKTEYEQKLAYLKASITDPECTEYLDSIRRDIDDTRYILSIIDRGIDSRAGKECVERIQSAT